MHFHRVKRMLSFREEWKWVSYAFLPFYHWMKFALISLWILSGTVLYGIRTSWSAILRVVILAEFIWLLPMVLKLLYFSILSPQYSLSDLKNFQPLSLMNLFDPEWIEPWLVFPLKALNLFEVAYMFVLAIGIKKVIHRDFNTSLGFIVPVYGLGLVSWIVFITFLSINLSA